MSIVGMRSLLGGHGVGGAACLPFPRCGVVCGQWLASCFCFGAGSITGATIVHEASFEVEINGVLVFSKMEKKGFPVFDEIVQRVVDASKNMEVQPATSIDKSWCCIL
ncbi:hypothetical protein HPB47_018035 [Ixodes persulcatus]|uniref:Uncharacterized protein n=1 Tax=Ixodes persulcatus TaxID=34615 RepID=A0AC60QQB7_IXOPE|nr:hypothetical protein HPB47_018035 [Ixodes persulcatus]